MYNVFLSSENGKECVFKHSVEKDLVETAKSNRTDDNNDDGNNDDDPRDSEDEACDEEQVDDWMLLCRINQNYKEVGNCLSDDTLDWFQPVRNVPTDLLKGSRVGFIVREKMQKNLVKCKNYMFKVMTKMLQIPKP